uniref:Ribosome assembly factor mrt4 n=1 Tax=Trichuris muris TaxID=70415 RepID=A0A5S6R5V1_TRIMR
MQDLSHQLPDEPSLHTIRRAAKELSILTLSSTVICVRSRRPKMPRSKRDKEISLTRVRKKGRAANEKLVEKVRKFVDEYEHVVLFTADNMRTTCMNEVRTHFRDDSRFLFGRNSVIAIALGRQPSEEYGKNLHKLSRSISGQCGLMFTQRSAEDIVSFFKNYSRPEYARSGNVATRTVSLAAGPLVEVPFNMEPYVRKLGLPVVLQKGVVMLERDHTVCKQGDTLTPEQAKILEIFGEKLATFRVHVLLLWCKSDGTVRSFARKKSTSKSK